MKNVDHKLELQDLKKLGFVTNNLNKYFNNLKDLYKYSEEINRDRQELNYPIDGLVVKLSNNEQTELLGVVGKTPRTWSAIKFAPNVVSAICTDVIWQIGRTGKVTPVITFEPVQLSGSIVERATLHNFAEFVTKSPSIGDILLIRKAGDIIPEVVNITKINDNHTSLMHPSLCPSCNHELLKSDTGIDLLCTNSRKCKDQIVLSLSYFCTRNIANISGLSAKTIEKLVNDFGVTDIADLLTFDCNRLRGFEGFGEKSINNLKINLDKAGTIIDYKFIAGLGIDGVGQEGAKLIAKKLLN